jgi:hypothetical protein
LAAKPRSQRTFWRSGTLTDSSATDTIPSYSRGHIGSTRG